MRQRPLALDEIVTSLDVHLEVEFSFLKTEQPAQVIAGLARAEQRSRLRPYVVIDVPDFVEGK